MKVCPACYEIVSDNQRCALPNCPNQEPVPTAAKLAKVVPGPTGKSDRVVQAGLDRAGDVARDATRRAAFAIATVFLFTLAIAAIGSHVWGGTDSAAAAAEETSQDNNIDKIAMEAAFKHAECQSGDSQSCDREMQLARKLREAGMCLKEFSPYIVEWRKC